MTTVKMPPVEEQMRIIMRGVEYGDANVHRAMEMELRGLLARGKPLRVYLGVDPTSPELHLGHCVPLRKLRQFQDLGHHVVLVIGNFTALIGDPSDKESERPMLTEDEVAFNARTYLQQAGRLLDLSRAEVRHNGDWLGKLSFRDLIPMAAQFTVAQFLNRESFAKRYQRGDPIHLHELFYALMQGYDAVALDTDVQVGGTDQLFNIMAGRELQRYFGQRPQVAVLLPILLGTDGHLKMSKSVGNHIPIDTTPQDMYGKVMSIPDSIIMHYFELLTDLPDEEVDELGRALASRSVNPMEVKMRLAREIVAQFYGAEQAQAAEEEFTRVFRQREAPSEVVALALPFGEIAGQTLRQPDLRPRISPLGQAPSRPQAYVALPDGRRVPIHQDYAKRPPQAFSAIPDYGTAIERGEGIVISVAEAIRTVFNESRQQAQRLIAEGAVEVDGLRIQHEFTLVRHGSLIRVGKHRFLRIVDADREAQRSS